MTKLIAIACLALLGCGRPDCGAINNGDAVTDGQLCSSRVAGSLVVSPRFPAVAQEMIVQAADDWSAATYGHVHMVVSIGEPADLNPINGTSGRIGRTYEDGRMYVSADLPDDLLRATAAHELGHYFGLGHTQAGELMTPLMTAPLGITPADVEHFFKLYGERQ